MYAGVAAADPAPGGTQPRSEPLAAIAIRLGRRAAVKLIREGAELYVVAKSGGRQAKEMAVDSANQGAISSYTFTNVQANHTILAAFVALPTYTITASAGTNGSISPTGAVTVIQGNSQSFTMSPNSGYAVSQVLVDGANQGAPGSYTFTNVTANHTITAIFAPSIGLALPADTVAYYSFDASGNLGQDASTHSNHLVTASGTPAFSGSGKFGGTLSLNGSSKLGIDAARSALPTGLNQGANPFSVSVWL